MNTAGRGGSNTDSGLEEDGGIARDRDSGRNSGSGGMGGVEDGGTSDKGTDDKGEGGSRDAGGNLAETGCLRCACGEGCDPGLSCSAESDTCVGGNWAPATDAEPASLIWNEGQWQ
jgi:hypothetical protein